MQRELRTLKENLDKFFGMDGDAPAPVRPAEEMEGGALGEFLEGAMGG